MRQTTTQQTLSSYTLTVTDALLAGQTISAVDGCTVTINGAATALPHTLAVGEVLAVTHSRDRTHPSGISLLAQVGTDAPAGALPDPDPAQWTYVDKFARTFLGADYTTDLSGGQQAQLQGGGLNLGQAVQVSSSTGDYARARLVTSRWNSPNVSVQYDSSYVYPQGAASIRPSYGVRVVGSSKALSWNGQRLGWGNVTLGTASGTAPATVGRTRLTVDTVAARIQVQLDGTGLIDVPLPADYVAQMAGQGLVELFHETNSTGAVGGTTSATFDNLAIRNGDGTANLGSGSPGTSVRYGSQWRLSGGAPDDALGVNGDIWLDTSSSALYQRVNGSYQAAGNIRGPQGLPGLPGVAGAPGKDGSGIARLSNTEATMPLVFASGATSDHAISVYAMRFTTGVQIAAEGIELATPGLTSSSLVEVQITVPGGGALAYGIATQTNADGTSRVTFQTPANLPPGTYVLTLYFAPGTTLTLYDGAQTLQGATAFTVDGATVSYSFYQLTLITGPGNVVGRLSAGGMRVVPTPSTAAAEWYNGCFEVVAPAGAAPYLRTRHAGVNYKLALVPE